MRITKRWKVEWTRFPTDIWFVEENRIYTGITVYRPSEWLYFLIGFLPERYHDIADRIRWKLENLGL